MRLKILAALILLAAMLYALNGITGWYLASLLDTQLHQLRTHNQTLDFQYDRLRVNPVMGSVTLRKLDVVTHDRQLNIKRARGSLTYADIWRMLRQQGSNPVAVLQGLRLSVNDLFLENPETGIIKIRQTNVIYSGQLDDLFSVWSQNVSSKLLDVPQNYLLPQHNHQITLHFRDIETRPVTGLEDDWHSLSLDQIPSDCNEEQPDECDGLPEEQTGTVLSLITSGISNQSPDGRANSTASGLVSGLLDFVLNHINGETEELRLQVRYHASNSTLHLNNMHVNSASMKLQAAGQASYDSRGWLLDPHSWSLRYQLHTRTNRVPALPLPGIAGTFTLDTLSASGQISNRRITDEERHQASVEEKLFLTGNTSLYLGGIYWYPSQQFLNEYGMVFGLLGIPHEKLPVHSMETEFRIESDSLFIDEMFMMTEPFDARLLAVIATPPDADPSIGKASLTFVRTSADFDDFVDGFESLFQIELPRSDGRIRFDFYGDPRSPEFELPVPR